MQMNIIIEIKYTICIGERLVSLFSIQMTYNGRWVNGIQLLTLWMPDIVAWNKKYVIKQQSKN